MIEEALSRDLNCKFIAKEILNFKKSISDSFFTVDLMDSYTIQMSDSELKLSVGVTNLFDEEVPLVYDAANWSYDPKHHDPRGRMVYVGFKLSR